MDDKDYIFARFKDEKSEATDRRETLTIPKRGGAPGSRVVEVVHVRSGGAVRDRPQRLDPYVRAASWDGGFPTKQPARSSMPIEPVAPEAAEPVTHVMPGWEPAAAKADAAVTEEIVAAPPRERPRKQRSGEPTGGQSHALGRRSNQPASLATRRVADPFDASDEGANCMRCGYAIEPAREKRGLMTCSECW